MKPLRVLVGCEESGVVRRAFRALGHDAWSCDLRPAADGSPYHLQCDVLTVLNDGWDMMIVFPDCTYLTNSAAWAYADPNYDKFPGVGYHQRVKPETLVGEARRDARERALVFVQTLLDAPIPMIALENPVGCISTRIRPASQYVQPHDYGDDASKCTGLWLVNLPKLKPTIRVAGRMIEWPRGSGKMVERWSNQTDGGQNKLPQTDDRWSIRSKTYEGLASAMALKWGGNSNGRLIQ